MTVAGVSGHRSHAEPAGQCGGAAAPRSARPALRAAEGAAGRGAADPEALGGRDGACHRADHLRGHRRQLAGCARRQACSVCRTSAYFEVKSAHVVSFLEVTDLHALRFELLRLD